jgi:hypothetical protein
VNWTTPADLRAQVQRLWDRGEVLAAVVRGEPLFPRRLPIRGPSAADISDRFEAVRQWITVLRQGDGRHYRLAMRDIRHRLLGPNQLPEGVWLDSLDAAVAWIGKTRELRRFGELLALTRERQPRLMVWLAQKPLKALEVADAWPRLLDLLGWLQAHPRPGIYLRQVDMPGAHSKFIEQYRGVLSELLDRALPAEAIDTTCSGISRFAARYGFLDKPQRIRLRWLDTGVSGLPAGMADDLTLRQDAFARLNPAVRRVFITENEINFLALPPLPESLAIFGAGYGFEVLEEARWLRELPVFYWGDIDTHGFAILDQLRSYLPEVHSILMDRATLMAHAGLWLTEPNPLKRELPRLNPEEAALYDDLRDNRLGRSVRLEQEAIGFAWVRRALSRW